MGISPGTFAGIIKKASTGAVELVEGCLPNNGESRLRIQPALRKAAPRDGERADRLMVTPRVPDPTRSETINLLS